MPSVSVDLLGGRRRSVVDEEDASAVQARRWGFNRGGYAVASLATGKRGGKTIYLHRFIAERMGLAIKGKHVDHVNGDKLDNRRSNLRAATASQNLQNVRRLFRGNTSGMTGVSRRRNGRWRAYLKLDQRQIHLGLFATFEEARRAREEGERRYFPFSPLNSVATAAAPLEVF